MDDRTRFHAALKEVFVPFLREHGFKGSGSTFYRANGDVIQVVNVQGNRYGGSCCVNLGIHLSFLPDSMGSLCSIPSSLKITSCALRGRLCPDDKGDHWWIYGDSDGVTRQSATHLAAMFNRVGVPLLERYIDFPGRFVKLTPHQLAGGNGDLPPSFYLTIVRAALTLARIAAHVGDRELARAHAQVGLEHLGPATSIKTELEAFL